MTEKLIILDRDGVINQDSADYVKSADEWIPLPGSIEAIAALKERGYRVAIATNQSGIGRGLYDDSALKAMHDKLARLLVPLGATIDIITYCPHTPEDACDCRKPKPGLLLQIGAALGLPLDNVWVVGDSLRDLQAAQSVNAQPVLVLTGNGKKTRQHPDLPAYTLVFPDLAAVADACT